MTSDDGHLDETQQHLSLGGRIDHLCDRFEALWRAGMAPSIDEFLTGWDEPERTPFEEELKRIQRELERGAQDTFSTDAQKKQFGDYELLEEVARGGMGVVYKARQIKLNRTVALKMILSGQFASKEDVQRFHSEAEAAAKLDHSGIVPIYEVGERDGQHYFSMGFVEGQSLTAKLKEGPLSPREAAQLTQKVAEAIAHAHQHGVIHRDLKPSNILLKNPEPHAKGQGQGSGSGLSTLGLQPMVTDFGLAKQVDSGDHLTTTGQVLGTDSYMPPEQAAGKANEIEPTADVYGLGAVLYCTLTGRPPFQSARVVDTLLQVVHQEPVSPRLLNSKVTRDLETICLKCLEKDPKRRYQTATELAGELGRWLAGEPIQARPTSTSEQIVKWAKRRPAVAGLLVVGLLAIVASVGVIVGAFYNARLQESLNETEQARQVAEESRQRAEQAKEVADQARQVAEEANQRAEVADYFRRIALARAEWQGGNIGHVEPLLNGCPEKYRQWEWHYLKRLCHNDLLTFKGHGGAVRSVDFSPDGKRLASGAGREVKIWDATTGKELLAMEGHTEPVYSVTFSPDGKRLASAGDDKTVKVWDAATGEEIITLKGHAMQIRGLAFSADGGRLASVGGSHGGELKVWDSTTGQLLRSFDKPQPFGDCISVAFSPDGQWLAAGGGRQGTDGQVTIWDAKDFRQVHILKGHTLPVQAVAFSPEGDRIASASGDHTVKVWNVMTGTEILTVKHDQGVTGVAFSPDGKRIASSSEGQTVKVWDAMNGQEILELKGHVASVLDVAFSPDGKRLASGSVDMTVKVWDATRDRNQLTLKGHPDNVNSVAFSPNGKQIASSSGGRTTTPGEVRIWDAMTGRLALTIQGDPEGVKGHADGVRSMAFSPDGNWVASASWRAVKVWDAKTGELLRDLRGVHWGISCVACSPDGRHLATASADKTVVVWDATTGDKVHTLRGHTGEVRCVAFSPDGRRIASAGQEKTVRVWNTMTGKEVLTFPSRVGGVRSVAFSPDGRWLALGDSGGCIVVYDAASGARVMGFYGLGHMGVVGSVAFSPDGKRLASGSSDQTVRIWDLTTRQEVMTLKGHTGAVRSVAFSPDGWRLASASQDRTVRIWDATPLSP